LDLASAMIAAGVTSPADLAAARKQRLLASRSPMDSSSFTEPRLPAVLQHRPEADGDFVSLREAQLPFDELIAQTQSFQPAHSNVSEASPSDEASESSGPAAESGEPDEGGTTAVADSSAAKGPKCLQVLRATFGVGPAGFALGMQCVQALLHWPPSDPLPLDAEIGPILRQLDSDKLLSLGAFLKVALPSGKWSASVRSSRVLPLLEASLAGLCEAYRGWVADGSDDVVRLAKDLGGGGGDKLSPLLWVRRPQRRRSGTACDSAA
jgi:hypothetical protein